MKLMTRFFACVLLMAAAIGCAARDQVDSPGAREGLAEDTICSVLINSKERSGDQVRLRSKYRTDNAHFEYLVDVDCGVLNISNLGVQLSQSVKDFYSEVGEICKNQGALVICNIEADMDATIRIVELEDGRPGADLIEIHKYGIQPAAK